MLFGLRFIWPSLTASKAPDWYTTPDIVFGKLELFTRFNTTAATATCPEYGSPLASPYTTLANRFKLLELEDEPLDDEDVYIPIALSVAGPAIPSTAKPFFL